MTPTPEEIEAAREWLINLSYNGYLSKIYRDQRLHKAMAAYAAQCVAEAVAGKANALSYALDKLAEEAIKVGQLRALLESRPIVGQHTSYDSFIEAYHKWAGMARAL